VVSESLKLYQASNDDYCTLEASPTFRKKNSSFCSTSGSRRLDAINHVFHTSRATKQQNRFNFSPRAVTRVKFS
jgi:hypothetical protein